MARRRTADEVELAGLQIPEFSAKLQLAAAARLPVYAPRRNPIDMTGGFTKDPTLFALLVPGVFKVQEAKARVERRLGLLRHVEALRLYAAEHDGKLPARLADIKVPLPVDPFTGKAFLYGLAARGGAGVTLALEIIRKELEISMALCGESDVRNIGPHVLVTR